jgi:hypothetical protein
LRGVAKEWKVLLGAAQTRRDALFGMISQKLLPRSEKTLSCWQQSTMRSFFQRPPPDELKHLSLELAMAILDELRSEKKDEKSDAEFLKTLDQQCRVHPEGKCGDALHMLQSRLLPLVAFDAAPFGARLRLIIDFAVDVCFLAEKFGLSADDQRELWKIALGHARCGRVLSFAVRVDALARAVPLASTAWLPFFSAVEEVVRVANVPALRRALEKRPTK